MIHHNIWFLNKVFPALSSSQSVVCNPFSPALVLWVPISPYLLSYISFNLSCENLIVHQQNIPKLMPVLFLYSSCLLLLKEQIVSHTRPATLISPFKSTQSFEVNYCELSPLSNLYLEVPVEIKSMRKLLSLLTCNQVHKKFYKWENIKFSRGYCATFEKAYDHK